MTATSADVFSTFSTGGLLQEVVGQERSFERIAAIEDSGPGTLVFMDKAEHADLVRERQPSIVVTSGKLKELLAGMEETTVLIAANLKLAHALLKQRYGGRRYEAAGWGRIDPSAVVHPEAEVAPTAWIEPRAVVGKGVKIGERARVMAGAVIEHDAVIGSDSVIHPNAVIGYGCVVGNEVTVGSCTVVGSEGYGFAQDARGKSHPIPQTGNVVLEDRVRLGANCSVDRATYHSTRIGAGTKVDNQCHIAHNVSIGQDCLLTAMLCVAGSTQIGDRVMASGQTGILDHVKVCSDVVLVHRAGVSKDISKPGVYAGAPVQPMKEYMRNTATMRNLAEMRRRLAELEAAVQGE